MQVPKSGASVLRVSISWKVFREDLARLWRTRKVWVILVGLMITPALYSWVNIAAFWDPYENTGNIKVAVVNEDEGASSDLTGDLDVGAELVKQLKDNDRLGWQFINRDEANHAVHTGDVFASITVPKTFSQDFVSLFQGTYSQPTLEYAVNEKLNAIAPKITDQGASTIDSTISAAFNEQVAQSVAAELRKSGHDLDFRIGDTASRASDSFIRTAETVAQSRDRLAAVQSSLDNSRPAIAEAREALVTVERTIDDAQIALGQVESITNEVQRQLTTFADEATAAYVQGTTALADGAASAHASVNSVSGQLTGALNRVGAATDGASGIVDQAEQAIDRLGGLARLPALPPQISGQIQQTVDDLHARNSQNRAVLGELSVLHDSAQNTLNSLNDTAAALDRATDAVRADSVGLRDSINNTVPQLNSAISRVSATAANLSATLGAQKSLLGETDGLLDGVDTQLGRAKDVIGNFREDLDGIENGLNTARTDILALANLAQDNPALRSVNALNADEISSFLASPAEMESHAVFPVSHYGSGMSSLFINLTLWIGAFMLMIIFRTEVDSRGREGLTVQRAYQARYLLMGVFGIMQALIVSIGNLVIGVEHVSAIGYVLTATILSLCYLAIIYGLVSAFGHIGRIIAVVYAFVQIPGASGLYPIEMTPDFFRAIHPFLPFTYGIGAMRETVGGFYGNHYWSNLATIIAMAAVAFLVGMLARRGLSHVNILVNDQLEKGGLVINEKVHLTGSPYRITDVVAALRDREGYQESLDSKWRSARRNYSQWMGITIGVGALLVLILGIVSRFNPDEKAVFFGLACLVVMIAVVIICALEYIKQSIARDNSLADLSDDELQEQLAKQGEKS